MTYQLHLKHRQQESRDNQSMSAGSPAEVAAAAPPQKGASSQVVAAMLSEGLSFVGTGRQISFGDSPQDVCSELGCPSHTSSKPREQAASPSQAAPCNVAQDYFYSYRER